MELALLHKVEKSFKSEFNQTPILIFSPGRINLIGEHIDYNDGFVFPAAIDKGIVLGIQKTEEDHSVSIAQDFEESFLFDVAKIDKMNGGGWRNYLIGVVREIKKLDKTIGNFNVIFSGNIPAGAGLSSSAALENAFVFGLNELFDLKLSKKEMILISQKAEHNYVGVKCGIMDQFASMFGQKDHFLLLDCKDLSYKAYQIDLKDYELVLINTNVQHKLSDSTYNKRRELCERAASLFGKSTLRELSKSILLTKKDNFTSEEFEMITYILEEIERTQAAAKAIKEGDILTLGKLLYKTHYGLSNQYQVSCEELDFLVEFAKNSGVVIGARMMGGGFGGCTINLIQKISVDDFITSVCEAYRKVFGFNCTPFHVNLSNGTHKIKS